MPNGERHWWGLASWFEGDKMKIEFENRIPDLKK